MRKQGSLRGIILLVISFSVINYVVSKSVRLRQADTLFLYPLGRFAPVLYIRLNAKNRLFRIFLGKDCSESKDEERDIPYSTELKSKSLHFCIE